jgi:hypothetical protein
MSLVPDNTAFSRAFPEAAPLPLSSACALSRARLEANHPGHNLPFFRAARKVRRRVAESG